MSSKKERSKRLNGGGHHDGFSPPEITRDPANKQLRLGDKIILQVVATGTPVPSYLWYHNGNVIPGATGSRLFIPLSRAEHAGQYRVEVYNFVGRVFSKQAVVSFMHEKSFELEITPDSAVIEEGGGIKFTIKTPELDALKQFNFQWLCNKKRILMANKPFLELTDANEYFNGEYSLVVTKGRYIQHSNTAFLTVTKGFQTQSSEEKKPLPILSDVDFFDPNEEPGPESLDPEQRTEDEPDVSKKSA